MIPIDEFELGVENDQFYVKDVNAAVDKSTVALMSSMLDLYNLTDKVQQHRSSDIWQVFESDREAFSQIFSGVNKDTIPFFKKVVNNKNEQVFIGTFFKTRALDFRSKIESSDSTRMLLPFIDFVNHHPKAQDFM